MGTTEVSHIHKKRTRMSAQDRRRQIVRTAMELFARKGFNGTTTKEISLEAGVNEAIIFRHFATKEELYAAIIDYKMQEGQEKIRSVLERNMERKDDQAIFENLAYGILEFHRRDGTFMRLLLHSALERHDLSRIFYETHVTPNFRFIADYIAQRIKDGAYRPVDAKAAARAFIGMVAYQAQVRELFDPNGRLVRLSSRQAARTFADIFLRGVLQPERARRS
ncbi:MAG: TetR/AcrR family transcriptional regulator [Acidobacteria bacterium]|nr:TetR/AcrR family transcriptional regulator [Acidobacteriota bacterium]